MSILVTGGAGFIGSHVVQRLLAETDEPIVALDNFDPFYEPARKRQNLAEALQYERFTLVEADIRDEAAVQSIWQELEVKVVIHLAALAGVRPSLRRPLEYADTNVRGTLVLLEAARRFGCSRFLFASSATVYGNDTPAPFREDRLGSVPASPYGVTKRSGELLCRLYHQLYGLPVLTLRYFSAYGPRLRPDLAMSIFARAIVRGDPLPVFGRGTQQRDFTYIDDIVDGTVAAWRSSLSGTEVNLGHQEPIPIMRIIELLEQQIGKPAKIEFLPEQPGEMHVTCADTSKAREAFGYDPKTPIELGVQKFVDWFLTLGL